MLLNALLHLLSAQHVSGTYMPIIRSSRLDLCHCRIWCVMPWLLMVGGQVQDSRLCVRYEGSCRTASHIPEAQPAALHLTADHQQPRHYTPYAVVTQVIVSSSWWWAYMCPKHVEQIISAIKHSVTSSWFSSLRLYNDARTNIHQIQEAINRVVSGWYDTDSYTGSNPGSGACFIQYAYRRFNLESRSIRCAVTG